MFHTSIKNMLCVFYLQMNVLTSMVYSKWKLAMVACAGEYRFLLLSWVDRCSVGLRTAYRPRIKSVPVNPRATQTLDHNQPIGGLECDWARDAGWPTRFQIHRRDLLLLLLWTASVVHCVTAGATATVMRSLVARWRSNRVANTR